MLKPLPLYIFRKKKKKKKTTFNGISEYKQQVGHTASNKLTFWQNQQENKHIFLVNKMHLELCFLEKSSYLVF